MNKNISKAIATLLVSAASVGSSFAQDSLSSQIYLKMTNIKTIEEITPSPFEGIFVVKANNGLVFYTDKTANYSFYGTIIDNVNQKVAYKGTNQSIKKSKNYTELELKNSFSIIHGSGANHIAIFTDPNCSHCKVLQSSLDAFDNVTIHVFMTPILGKSSIDLANKIWCAKDQSNAWKGWMLKNIMPESAPCDADAIANNLVTASKMRITTTPTTIFSDGTIYTGEGSTEIIKKFMKNSTVNK